MPKTLADMSLYSNAVGKGALSAGALALIQNIIDGTNTSNIWTPGGTGNKEKFFNHGDDRDPSTGGGKCPIGVTVNVYYMPANGKEYASYEVIDKAVGMLSGRRRLVTREQDNRIAFFFTSHPRPKPGGLKSNAYIGYTPINLAKA